MINKSFVCFGETLWDILPSGSVPGGAPMNVAIRASSFGVKSIIISRVGSDDLGLALKDFLDLKQVDHVLIQQDKHLPTGKVRISLDGLGNANYNIEHPAAWDKIELNEGLVENTKKADAFIFGSLACRDQTSRNTLLSLLKYATFKVFDVNLRPGFLDLPLIEKLMLQSDLVKLNDEETRILAIHFGFKSIDLFENIKFLQKRFNLKSLCITRGQNGAVLMIENELYSNSGYSVSVVDTIGAGDSFLSALITKLISQKHHQESLDFACAVGAVVASKTGANAEISIEEVERLMYTNPSFDSENTVTK